jgi:hypothetical protein
MNTESDFHRDKLSDVAGLLVLLAIGVIGVSVLAVMFYVYW